MKLPTWALVAFLLAFAPSAIAQNQDTQSTPDPIINDPCAWLLPGNPEGYKLCSQGQRRGLGVWCEILTRVPTGGTVVTGFRWVAGATICPDNPIDDAIDRGLSRACTGGKVWQNGGCHCPSGTRETSSGNCIPSGTPSTKVQVPVCTGGKVLDSTMQRCVCPAGKTENSQGLCVSQQTRICTRDSEGRTTCSTPSTPDARDLHQTPLTNQEIYEQEQKIEDAINNDLRRQNCPVAGQIRDDQGNCVVPPPASRPNPQKPTSVKPVTQTPVVPNGNGGGSNTPQPKQCVGGQILNPRTGNCNCPTGQSWSPATRQCSGPSLCTSPLIYNQQLSRCTCPPGLSWDGTNCLSNE